MRNEWPLVGRDGELDFARRALRTPRLAGLVLAGRPGVGKTRLAREILERARAGGAALHWARATRAGASIPLGAMAHLLPDWDSGLDQVGRLRAAARALVDSAKGKRLVLGVDDAAQLDAASATLVYHLCHTSNAFVVVTAETGASVPDPIFLLWKDGLAERLDLAELSRPQTDELVTSVLGEHVDGAALQDIWKLTLGNPLFLREIVEGGRESGSLSRIGGIWRSAGPLAPGPRLLELIETRIGALSEDERTLLELLTYGEPLGSEVLVGMGGQRVLTTAERKNLVTSERSGRRVDVRLVHPLYAEVVRGQTSPLRERRAYQILAAAIERTGARRATDNTRIATWRLAGGLPTDPRLLLRTATQAVKIDYWNAERLARAAAEQDTGFDARYLLAQVLTGSGQAEEAERTLSTLEADTTDDDQRARLAVTRVYNLYWALGDGDRARAVLAEATRSVTSQAAKDELTTVNAAMMLNSGSCASAVRELDEVLARPGLPDRVRLEALTTMSQALAGAGRCDDALEAAERGIELATRTEDPTTPWGPVALEAGRCGAHARTGHLDEAWRLAEDGYQRALSHHWPSAKAVHASWLGIVALMRGRVRTARRWLDEAAASAKPAPFPFLVALLGELTVATALSGELSAARALLAETEAALSEATLFFTPWASASRCWVAAAGGETSRAINLAIEAADLAHGRGHHQSELTSLHDVVRLDSPGLVVDRLAATAETVQGELAKVYAEHAHALVAGDGARLDAAAARFGTIGTELLAAETAAQAARAHESTGRTSSGRASANRALKWAANCEGARTPALVRLRVPGDLTRRELEIAQLAASGLTSRAIAQRLVVSVRTVDNVLHSVYAKLGVSGRGGLAEAVGLPATPVPGGVGGAQRRSSTPVSSSG